MASMSHHDLKNWRALVKAAAIPQNWMSRRPHPAVEMRRVGRQSSQLQNPRKRGLLV